MRFQQSVDTIVTTRSAIQNVALTLIVSVCILILCVVNCHVSANETFNKFNTIFACNTGREERN